MRVAQVIRNVVPRWVPPDTAVIWAYKSWDVTLSYLDMVLSVKRIT
jgi:hypothetical protein